MPVALHPGYHENTKRTGNTKPQLFFISEDSVDNPSKLPPVDGSLNAHCYVDKLNQSPSAASVGAAGHRVIVEPFEADIVVTPFGAGGIAIM
jgi:hypothetical protein